MKLLLSQIQIHLDLLLEFLYEGFLELYLFLLKFIVDHH